MRGIIGVVGMTLLALFFLYGCQDVQAPDETAGDPAGLALLDQQGEAAAERFEGFEKRGRAKHIAIANRASGTVSLINTRSDNVDQTLTLPVGTNAPEPMYVVWQPFSRRMFVGDRANNRLVVYNDRDYTVEGSVAVGAGVFHMWADFRERQLWVVNDIDKTLSVINPRNLQTLATVPIPADLASLGGKPHDVTLSPGGILAYVSIVGVAGANDYVVQYNTRNFQEIGRAEVDKDPHLSVTFRNRFLYVPCQNGNSVIVLNRYSMNRETVIAVPGAHGAGMPLHGKTFYTTNLPGGGTDGLFAIDTRSNSVIGSADTPFAVPHNIALTPRAHKLYVTHSGGTSDKVTVYEISRRHPVPVLHDEVTVGLNPFGLAFTR